MDKEKSKLRLRKPVIISIPIILIILVLSTILLVNKDKDYDELSKQYEGAEVKTSASDTFGGADVVPREELAKLAAEQGMPYSGDELSIDLTELAIITPDL